MAIYMQGVNISIPNAALPHIQGTLSMADDEVGWVFTSYIAASVVVMPMTGWLAASYGRKAIYQVSLAVFAVGLVLATLARLGLPHNAYFSDHLTGFLPARSAAV